MDNVLGQYVNANDNQERQQHLEELLTVRAAPPGFGDPLRLQFRTQSEAGVNNMDVHTLHVVLEVPSL